MLYLIEFFLVYAYTFRSQWIFCNSLIQLPVGITEEQKGATIVPLRDKANTFFKKEKAFHLCCIYFHGFCFPGAG